MNSEHDCFEIASAGEPAHLREFYLPLAGKSFVVKITHPRGLQELRGRNAARPPSAQIDDRIYVFEDLASAEQLAAMTEGEICQRLHEIPSEILQPYLVKQTEE